MTNTATADPQEPGTPSDEQYEHVMVVDGDETIECTIFPRRCDDEEILTNWITAIGDSFVSLEEMR